MPPCFVTENTNPISDTDNGFNNGFNSSRNYIPEPKESSVLISDVAPYTIGYYLNQNKRQIQESDSNKNTGDEVVGDTEMEQGDSGGSTSKESTTQSAESSTNKL